MLKQIISGGQTGADRAALDVALKFNIPHGGWIPKGRRAEDGPLSRRYRLEETDSRNYAVRTRRNVRTGDATVIFSHGPLTGGSRLTQEIAREMEQPCRHLDLLVFEGFEAAMMLRDFIRDYRVRILNVAGSRASLNPDIYWGVRSVLETLVFMDTMDDVSEEALLKDAFLVERRCVIRCEDVAGAADFIVSQLHLRSRSIIANLPAQRIAGGYFALADAIKVKLGLENENPALLSDCAGREGLETITPEDAAMVIFKAVKARLEKDHILRVIP